MYIETVSQQVIAVTILKTDFFKRAEGASVPLSARALVRQTLERDGREPWPDMEMEIFSSGDSLLIMARPSSGGARLFQFSGAEELIEAVLACPDGLPSSLLTFEGRLCLIMRCRDLPMRLFEYGDGQSISRELALHLSEHGEVLIGNAAIDTLKSYFAGTR